VYMEESENWEGKKWDAYLGSQSLEENRSDLADYGSDLSHDLALLSILMQNSFNPEHFSVQHS